MSKSLKQSCIAEVADLHAFFVAWMTGALPRAGQAFERFTGVMADDMVLISPRGVITERRELCDELEAAHGIHAGAAKGFRIAIENPHCRMVEADLCLVTHEEWQRSAGTATGRLSTALLRRRAGTPNGVEWLHVHETWLPSGVPGT